MSLIDVTKFETPEIAPHSQEAEEATLGSVLINPNAFYEISDFLKSGDFFILRNGWAWEAMERLAARKDSIEYLTVINELKVQGRLEDIGGVAYITYLTSSAATSLNVEAYARIVERAATRRRMLEAATEIIRLARDEEKDITEATGDAEKALSAVLERNGSNDSTQTMLEASSAFYDTIEYRFRNPDLPIGVTSGFVDVDKLLYGFQKSDLYILAGRTGMGKTSLMLNLGVNAAKAGARVAMFSPEMNAEQLLTRIYATETGINSQKLRLGRLSENEFKLFVEAKTNIDKLKMLWDDTPAISMMQLRTKCRRMMRKHGLDMVFVDYIQLMRAGSKKEYKDETRAQEVSYIARGLKELARELNIPVIVGSQLSRALESRADKRPILSDLKESGSIEENADVVLFIYRDDVYNEASERPNEADIIVAKHRNGPTGTATLFFRKQLTQFVNIKKTEVNLGDI